MGCTKLCSVAVHCFDGVLNICQAAYWTLPYRVSIHQLDD